MKKSYMGTIIGSSRRDHFLIILFQLYGSKTVSFEGNLFWVVLISSAQLETFQ